MVKEDIVRIRPVRERPGKTVLESTDTRILTG